jgi:hypothetical protein
LDLVLFLGPRNLVNNLQHDQSRKPISSVTADHMYRPRAGKNFPL